MLENFLKIINVHPTSIKNARRCLVTQLFHILIMYWIFIDPIIFPQFFYFKFFTCCPNEELTSVSAQCFIYWKWGNHQILLRAFFFFLKDFKQTCRSQLAVDILLPLWHKESSGTLKDLPSFFFLLFRERVDVGGRRNERQKFLIKKKEGKMKQKCNNKKQNGRTLLTCKNGITSLEI